jgi:hypothetical protein
MTLERALRLLLGGRPMRFEKFAFTDVVSGLPVNYYTDTLGRKWMANTAWSLFRVERE